VTPEELAEIEARAEAATPGPWELEMAWNSLPYGEEVAGYWDWYLHIDGDTIIGGQEADKDPSDDLKLIKEARQDIPKLIAEVRRLQEELEEEQRYAAAMRNRALEL
jgi:hypothetical protein